MRWGRSSEVRGSGKPGERGLLAALQSKSTKPMAAVWEGSHGVFAAFNQMPSGATSLPHLAMSKWEEEAGGILGWMHQGRGGANPRSQPCLREWASETLSSSHVAWLQGNGELRE